MVRDGSCELCSRDNPAEPKAAQRPRASLARLARLAGRGWPKKRQRFAGDSSGQMMMLAAVVLLVGFIALAGMVARVGVLGAQTGREQQRAMFLELDPMIDGVNDAVSRLESEGGFEPLTDDDNAALYEDAIRGVLEHMRRLEASRGFLFEYQFGCATPGDPNTGYVAVSLADNESWIEIRSELFRRATTATPC